MEKIRVLIIGDGFEAKEINPFKKPSTTLSKIDYDAYRLAKKAYIDYQIKLRIFKVEPQFTGGWTPSYNNPDGFGVSEDEISEPIFYEVGDEYEAEVINETTVKIIS